MEPTRRRHAGEAADGSPLSGLQVRTFTSDLNVMLGTRASDYVLGYATGRCSCPGNPVDLGNFGDRIWGELRDHPHT